MVWTVGMRAARRRVCRVVTARMAQVALCDALSSKSSLA